MILLIDNYDSFTYNLVHLIGEKRQEIAVHRNDKLTVAEAIGSGAEAIILSPGPCTPDEAGICLPLVKAAAEQNIPLLGVCLGHQAIAQAYGASIVRAGNLMHGKTSRIDHKGEGLFAGIPSPFTATRYHSLAIQQDSLTDEIVPQATAEDDGEIMAIKISHRPLFGVQFHPESISSEYGAVLIRNFLQIAEKGRSAA